MNNFLPYGRQIIGDDDIAAVVDVLRSDYLTTGPAVEHFEGDVCNYVGSAYGVAVSSGTAALHAVVHALGVGPGDEVIVPPITFAATSNCVLYCGGTPVFADVQADTLLIDPQKVEAAITPRTKAIIAVDYAGQPCDWAALRAIANKHGIALVADACHAIGASSQGGKVGTLADATVFSFHPVKHITTGEGGMVVTNDADLARAMRAFRGHGITTTAAEREKMGGWYYEMVDLGYNYRITDIQCALGSSQLKKLDGWIVKRNSLAQLYDAAFAGSAIKPLVHRCGSVHAYHLYVVRVDKRDERFKALRDAGIGVNVHYMPVYLHPYYQGLGYAAGLCPVAEEAYGKILTLPLWVGMDQNDVERVAQGVVGSACVL